MKKLVLLLILALPVLSFGQSRKVWLYHADNFYGEQDYYNALLNYENALSDSLGLQEATIPYEVTLGKLGIKSKERLYRTSNCFLSFTNLRLSKGSRAFCEYVNI